MASAKQLSESLECPICHELLCNPKLLPCSHSFCERCLTELYSLDQTDSELTCQVCRLDANAPGNDVSKFPTNLIVKSLVEDLKRRSDAKAKRIKGDGTTTVQTCTVCDGDDRDIATYYCQNCSEFLCEDCLQHHNRYKRNACHETVKANDIKAGVVKQKFTCPEHPQELQQFVCTTCLVRICCRCQEVEHNEEGHEVIEMTRYEERQQMAIECLLLKKEQTSVKIQNDISTVNEKLRIVKNVASQRRQEIENSYGIAEEKLQRKRNDLFEKCNTHDNTSCLELEGILEQYYQFLDTLPDMARLVNEGSKNLHLPDQSLAEHTARVNELERIIKAETLSPLLAQASNVVLRAGSLVFRPADRTILLGTVEVMDHQVDKEVEGFVFEATDTALAKNDTAEKKEPKRLLSLTPYFLSDLDDNIDLNFTCSSPTMTNKVYDITELLKRHGLSVGTSDDSDRSSTAHLSACPENNRGSTRSFLANLGVQVKRKARIRPRIRSGNQDRSGLPNSQ